MTGASRRGRRPAVHRGVELRCDTRFEDEARAEGRRVVAGVDEVGRGALCGPVVAAAVVLGDGFDATGLDDSKRLTRRQREELDARVRERARAFGIGLASPEEIDRVNILKATLLAMRRAVLSLPETPDLLRVNLGAVLRRRPGWPHRGCQQLLDMPQLIEQGAQVMGTDLSAEAVRRALGRGVPARQVDIDEGPLPFPDARFVDLLDAAGVRSHARITLGGKAITSELAAELGFDLDHILELGFMADAAAR